MFAGDVCCSRADPAHRCQTWLSMRARGRRWRPWPELWHNLRATRATKLVGIHSQHVVTSWCGHTETITAEHYWMTTEDDIQRAASQSFGANMVQQGVATDGNGLNFEGETQKESPEKPGSAKHSLLCESLLWRIGDLNQEMKTLEVTTKRQILMHI